MIVVTGGAGFIGSAVIWALNLSGCDDIIVVDHIGNSEKWKNLVGVSFADYFEKEDFLNRLQTGYFDGNIDVFIHMGACSSTTESNGSYLVENNYRYTVALAQKAIKEDCKFIYASSAATYGAGETGYTDDLNSIEHLKPLNMYGYSKQMFDLLAKRNGWFDRSGFIGLKFFNVFGPNENHKGSMRSLVNKAFPKLYKDNVIDLYKSDNPEYGDGQQKRDFVYVKDVASIVISLIESSASGILNIGSGVASSWNELAGAMFRALNREVNINYVEMPEYLRGKYQYYTCADITNLKKFCPDYKITPLADAVNDYINNYLLLGEFLG